MSLAEQTVQNYTSQRAGPHAQAVFADAAFRAALEQARSEAYPLALAMVAELAGGVLRSHAGANEQALMAGLLKLTLDLFDRKGVPKAVGDVAWSGARQEVSSALDEASSRPVKAISAIVEASAGLFLALMPLHPMLAADDFPALRASLEATLGEIREKLVRRADLPAVAAALASGAS